MWILKHGGIVLLKVPIHMTGHDHAFPMQWNDDTDVAILVEGS